MKVFDLMKLNLIRLTAVGACFIAVPAYANWEASVDIVSADIPNNQSSVVAAIVRVTNIGTENINKVGVLCNFYGNNNEVLARTEAQAVGIGLQQSTEVSVNAHSNSVVTRAKCEITSIR